MTLGFHNYIVNFALSREISSLDSQIHLYRMETLIPQVVPKKYENLCLNEITNQGAYIRCMTLMVVEGMINNVITAINCAGPLDSRFEIQSTLNALERVVIRLFELNHKV